MLVIIFNVVLIICVVHHFGIKNSLLKLEKYRSKLFAIRNELFILAIDNEIKFDSEVYRYFEQKINSNIRFAHKLNFFVGYNTLKKMEREKTSLSLSVDRLEEEMLKSSPKKNREIFEKINKNITEAAFDYFYDTSLYFKVVFLIEYIKYFRDNRNSLKEKRDEIINEILEQNEFEGLQPA